MEYCNYTDYFRTKYSYHYTIGCIIIRNMFTAKCSIKPRNLFFSNVEQMIVSCRRSKMGRVSSVRADWLIAACHTELSDTFMA